MSYIDQLQTSQVKESQICELKSKLFKPRTGNDVSQIVIHLALFFSSMPSSLQPSTLPLSWLNPKEDDDANNEYECPVNFSVGVRALLHNFLIQCFLPLIKTFISWMMCLFISSPGIIFASICISFVIFFHYAYNKGFFCQFWFFLIFCFSNAVQHTR